MNEQLQSALAAAIDQTLDGVQAGVTFLQAELPEVIQQLLMWKLFHSALLNLLGVSVLVVYVVLVRALMAWARHGEESKLDSDDRLFAAIMATAINGVIALLIAAITINLTWLKILVAPKIYLIEYAANLVK